MAEMQLRCGVHRRGWWMNDQGTKLSALDSSTHSTQVRRKLRSYSQKCHFRLLVVTASALRRATSIHLRHPLHDTNRRFLAPLGLVIEGVTSVFKRFFNDECELQILLNDDFASSLWVRLLRLIYILHCLKRRRNLRNVATIGSQE